MLEFVLRDRHRELFPDNGASLGRRIFGDYLHVPLTLDIPALRENLDNHPIYLCGEVTSAYAFGEFLGNTLHLDIALLMLDTRAGVRSGVAGLLPYLGKSRAGNWGEGG